MKTYVITGATGNTGKPIVLGLLEKGHIVRIISRSAEKAKELTDKGAILFQGDSSDAELLTRAFTGADAVYAMIPFNAAAPDYTEFQLTHVRAMTQALKTSGVKNVVTLSSIGAHLAEGAGVVQGLERMEKSFNSIPGINVLHLRAGYFMENLFGQIGAIKHMNVMATPIKGDMKMTMVATRDIAQMALAKLLDLNFSGTSHEYVMGQRDVSYNEVAGIIGKAIGKPDLKYYAASYEEGTQAMLQMGMGESVVSRMMEFVRTINEGRGLEDAKRTPANTTPTSIEDFAQVFKMVYSS